MHDPKGTRCFAKMDIRHFYDSIQLKILMRELAIRIKDDWFLYIIGLCLQGFNKGIPLGFYISQWLANYLLDPLDRLITEVLGLPKLQRYMDDIVIFASSKKVLQRAIVEIRKMLGQRFRLKLKHNYQVCKFYYEKGKRKIGRALDFMGFIFYRNKTLIRKNIMLSATRLAKKMERSKEANRGYFHRHIEAMLSYMGWFTCTDTYDCYQSRIKPYIHVGRLKKIISKIKRRQNHEGMDQGKMLRGAAGAAACGIRMGETNLGDFVADGIYIQRKNIEKVQHEATEGMEAYTDWECDSREITVSEYQMLESIKQINTDKAIDDYTAQLIEEGLL